MILFGTWYDLYPANIKSSKRLSQKVGEPDRLIKKF